MGFSGGNLASIHSLAENTCINAAIGDDTDGQAWFGFTERPPYSEDNRIFVWSDDSSAEFFNWNTDEPSTGTIAERCGRMYGPTAGTIAGKWNNDMCSKTAGFICQETGPPRPANCPGSASGTFNTLPECPASFLLPTKETTLNDMCASYCESNCPQGRYQGGVTIASPTGKDSTCVCFTTGFGTGGVNRTPYGGCTYKSGKALKISEKCSKVIPLQTCNSITNLIPVLYISGPVALAPYPVPFRV